MVESIKQYAKDNEKRYVEELSSWLRIPSISTLSEKKEDVRRAAIWAKDKLDFIGFPKVEMIEGSGHPLVYAEWLQHPDQPTLLVYGHYDVQPVDPLDEWHSSPFEPRIENDYIYARGATDDKGQVMAVLAALEAWAKAGGNLPINIKVLLEGEEEAGGAAVAEFVPNHPDKLQADAALICDTHMNNVKQPSLINGLRGVLYTEVAINGPRSDLHSGSYGGVAPNPIHALCLLISRLKGEDGKIKVSGLYDSPVEVSDEERSFWKENQKSREQQLLGEMGIKTLVGENDILPHERLGVLPTLEVHGIKGGFTGEGAKTVIPAEAVAKVSLRLPAGMKPTEVFKFFKKAVDENMPKGYSHEVRYVHGGEGVSVSPENKYVQAAMAAIESCYGKHPVFMREGGSIPIAALFNNGLKIPVVLMGFGLPDDGAHGPNEKFSLNQFKMGISTLIDYFGRLRR